MNTQPIVYNLGQYANRTSNNLFPKINECSVCGERCYTTFVQKEPLERVKGFMFCPRHLHEFLNKINV